MKSVRLGTIASVALEPWQLARSAPTVLHPSSALFRIDVNSPSDNCSAPCGFSANTIHISCLDCEPRNQETHTVAPTPSLVIVSHQPPRPPSGVPPISYPNFPCAFCASSTPTNHCIKSGTQHFSPRDRFCILKRSCLSRSLGLRGL